MTQSCKDRGYKPFNGNHHEENSYKVMEDIMGQEDKSFSNFRILTLLVQEVLYRTISRLACHLPTLLLMIQHTDIQGWMNALNLTTKAR